MIALALACMLAGCSDFAQRRFANSERPIDGMPNPAPALLIANPPGPDNKPKNDHIQKATFVPDREAPVSPQMLQNPMRVIYQRASQTSAGMDSYIFRLRRRESVNGRKMPEELVRVQFRRDPYSVHLKWLGAEGKGRETIYVKGKFDNKMQVLLANHDAFPFSPAGIRWSIDADDNRAKARSRYPITESGLGPLIERYGQIVTDIEKGDARNGTMKYLGRVNRPEFEAKVEAVHQVVPPKSDPNLPKGGQRWWYFDSTNCLPVLLITHDPDGEVEYYCHDHIQWPVRLDDDDFNPDQLWRK